MGAIQSSINQAISLSGLLLQTNPAFQDYIKKKAEQEKIAKIKDSRAQLFDAYEELANKENQTLTDEHMMEVLDKRDLELSKQVFELDPSVENVKDLVQSQYSVESHEEVRQEEAAKRAQRQAQIEYAKGIEEQNRQRARMERQQAEKAARMGLGFSAEDYLAAPSLLKKTLEGGY